MEPKSERAVVAIVAIFSPDGKILLVRTRELPNYWQPIGGKARDSQESPYDALVREVREETKIDLIPLAVKFETSYSWDLGIGNVFCYSVRLGTHAEPAIPAKEVMEAKWFDLDSASRLAMLPASKAFIEFLLGEAAEQSGENVGSTQDARTQIASEVQTVSGTLTDGELMQLCSAGKIITNSFEPASLRGSSYELRASKIYYELTESKQRIEVAPSSTILIKPKRTYVIITEESLAIPLNMMCRIVSKGSLFSVGLLPVSTWVDPGFSGRLGIVFYNSSHNYLKVQPGRAIAKIEFNRLANQVEHEYAGQHGFGTGVWPVSDDLILSDVERRTDARIGDTLSEASEALGPELGAVVRRVFRYERYLIATLLAYMFFSLLLIAFAAGGEKLNILPAIGLGIFANLLTAAIVLLATKLARKRR